ncbi:MAG: hypothetical protein KJ749_00400 [Planctomycetes bacterium]|nr:hypothetical protein [Planctomycetota bacterium]
MTDWMECDISGIPEEAFTVRCDRCDFELTGLGDLGRCPQCASQFNRRKLLWETYGPEAFADPPIEKVEQPDESFMYGLLAAVALTLVLPAILLAWYGLFGEFDLCFGLLAWVVVVVAIVWIMLVRRRRRVDAEDEPDA